MNNEYKPNIERYDIKLVIMASAFLIPLVIILTTNWVLWMRILLYCYSSVSLLLFIDLLARRNSFIKGCIPIIIITDKEIIYNYTYSNKQSIIHKNDILDVKYDSRRNRLSILLKDPVALVKRDIANDNITKANKFVKFTSYLILKRKMDITFKEMTSTNKTVQLNYYKKLLKYNEATTGGHALIFTEYYDVKEEMLEDINKLVGSKHITLTANTKKYIKSKEKHQRYSVYARNIMYLVLLIICPIASYWDIHKYYSNLPGLALMVPGILVALGLIGIIELLRFIFGIIAKSRKKK